MSKEQNQVRKELYTLCSYARCATQYREINTIVDNIRDSILHRIEQLENTLALSNIIDEQLLEEINKRMDRTTIDTYDEEGNQD